jgi:hypothetical protein
MGVNASVNVVVFEVEHQGKLDKFVGQGPTRADDCVRQVWLELSAKNGLRAEGVKRVYSEWEPSEQDKAFLDATFAAEVEVLFSFARPAAGGWDQALQEVEKQIRDAMAQRVAKEELSKPNDSLDDVLPVLRLSEPGDGFSELIVNRPVAPGLGCFLGHVNVTPRQTIGTRYVMIADLARLNKTAEELFAIACHNLASALRVEVVQVEGEGVFVVKHPLDVGASAIALPDLHANASRWTGAEEMFVGFPDPSTLFVMSLSHGKAIERLREAIVTSDYWGAVALTPACYRLDPAGLQLIAARPAPEAE